MVKKYIKTIEEQKNVNIIMDPMFILVALLLGEKNEIFDELQKIISNQNEGTIFSKEDL
jgi:hypothetical protein